MHQFRLDFISWKNLIYFSSFFEEFFSGIVDMTDTLTQPKDDKLKYFLCYEIFVFAKFLYTNTHVIFKGLGDIILKNLIIKINMNYTQDVF